MSSEGKHIVPADLSLNLQRVTESTVVAQHPWLASNAAAVVFDDFIVVIDAGLRPRASMAFREWLERTYRREVRFVCVTHYHADHTFGLSSYKDCALIGSRRLPGALERSPDWLPDGRVSWTLGEADGGDWLADVERVFPSVVFEGHLELACAGRHLELRTSAGHTACSTYAYLPDEKVLLAGDLVFAEQMPFAGDETTDPEIWMATLRLWLELDIDWVIPGHGPVCGPEEIQKHLKFFELLKHRTIAALESGLSSEHILRPGIYERVEQPWFWEKTRNRWFSYYACAIREDKERL